MPFFTRLQAKKNLARLETALTATPGGTSAASAPQWRKLQSQVVGKIILPGDSGYDEARRGNTLYPDLAQPLAIVYCEIEYDIVFAMLFCRETSIPFAIRSGGHSTAAYSVSGGIIIDISPLNGVFLNLGMQTATVQAGASLGMVNQAIAPYGFHVPGGECDTVGVAGHMMGGGYGFTSRIFGLNLDAVQQVRVMLADCSVVVASRDVNSDLFWAIRGGTGGNFGVLLDITYNLVQLGDLWGACYQWSQADAPAVLVQLQANYMRTGAPSTLGYQCAVSPVTGQTSLMMMSMFNGTRADGLALLQPVLTIGQPKTLYDNVAPYITLNAEIIDSWFPATPPAKLREVKASHYVDQPLSIEDWTTIIQYLATAPNPYNMFAMEIYGGAVSAVPVNDCAFIHRQCDFDMFIDSFCDDSWNYNDEATAKMWLEGFNVLMKNYGNGQRYQNYPDPLDLDYRTAYWGGSFSTLLAVKQKYDPTNFFQYQQSVSPSAAVLVPAAAGGPGVALPSTNSEIVYELHAQSGTLARR
ncbi:MAG TPA: FAD-binding oxidoreductase [Gemmatimonadaceae bacterium]